MELIEGDTLSAVLARERIPLGRSLELATEVAEGLARAQDKGIVHRDLKPANIMLTEDAEGLKKEALPLDRVLEYCVQVADFYCDKSSSSARRVLRCS